jgi:hypothetical protein
MRSKSKTIANYAPIAARNATDKNGLLQAAGGDYSARDITK